MAAAHGAVSLYRCCRLPDNVEETDALIEATARSAYPADNASRRWRAGLRSRPTGGSYCTRPKIRPPRGTRARAAVDGRVIEQFVGNNPRRADLT